MNTSEFHVVSRYFNLGEVHVGKLVSNERGGYFTINEMMEIAVSRINECLSKYPEAKHLSIEFRNLLERDFNPRGHVGFFIVNNSNDFSLIEKMRDPGWGDSPEHFPKTITIPSQDNDTTDHWKE